MRYDISMIIEAVREIHDDVMGDDYFETVITFRCETPLNEMDTCDMLSLYFGEIYYEESPSDFFVKKGDVFEMFGDMRVLSSKFKNELIARSEMIIPISDSLVEKLKLGKYDPNEEVNFEKKTEEWFGDLFDEQGKLIVHR